MDNQTVSDLKIRARELSSAPSEKKTVIKKWL